MSNKRSIFFTPFLTNPNVLIMEAKLALPTRCYTTAKVEPKMFLFSQSPGASIDNPGVAFAEVVPRPFWRLSLRNPLFLPMKERLLSNPKEHVHPLGKNGKLQLAAWTILCLTCIMKEYRKGLPTSFLLSERTAQIQITLTPRTHGLVCVWKDRLIHFHGF